MKKYYIIEWPESQQWSDKWNADNSLDIRLLDDQSVAVECTLYDGSGSVRNWYTSAYPSDELGEEIAQDATFEELWQDLHSGEFNEARFAADDSIVRERVFERLAEVMETPYDIIYDLWLSAAV